MKNELKAMFTEHWKYLAVSAACELNVFDKIFNGQNSLEVLIESNNWNFKTLKNLFDFLAEDGYLCLSDGIYALTEKGNLLREANPNGLYNACLNWSGEHLISWQNLKYSIESGKSSFEQIYKRPYFDYLNENSDKLIKYHKAMFQYAIEDYKELPQIIDFGVHKSIMDVGGSFGAAISLIQTKYQDSKCYLFDLQKVVDQVTIENIEKIGGDFFDKIPKCSEAIILSRVLHDWNDEKAILILNNCYTSLPNGGYLYVIENCTDKIPSNLSLLSLNMAVMCQSYERSTTEYKNICEPNGFVFKESKKLNSLQTILVFKK
jgi:C-methyltransferase